MTAVREKGVHRSGEAHRGFAPNIDANLMPIAIFLVHCFLHAAWIRDPRAVAD